MPKTTLRTSFSAFSHGFEKNTLALLGNANTHAQCFFTVYITLQHFIAFNMRFVDGTSLHACFRVFPVERIMTLIDCDGVYTCSKFGFFCYISYLGFETSL